MRYYRPIPTLTQDQIKRLFGNVIKKESGCWEWSKYRNPDGYGQMGIGRLVFGTHRLSWIATYGNIEPGLYVLHKCDNPPCINPDHLFLGTQHDNVQDCMKKMRLARAKGEAHGRSILTEKKVQLLREMHAEFGVPKTLLAEIAGVTLTNMSRVLNRELWDHV